MGRREAPVPQGPLHDFAQGLRDLRQAAGSPPYRELSRRADYTPSALSDAAAGHRLPTWEVTLAYVRACGGDEEEWRERWTRLRDVLRATDPALLQDQEELGRPDPAQPERPPGPAESAPPGPPDEPSPGTAGPGAPSVEEQVAAEEVASAHAVAPLEGSDPSRIGPFRLLGRLGSGAMGRVYLAVTRAGRPVAVKVIRSDLADDAYFRGRFAAEVAAARRVQGLYTPAVVDADPDGSPPWMATAYVCGPSLEEILDTTGALPPPVVRSLAAGIAEALQAVHAAGIVHRDLKPGNVLLEADGPKVIDFGVAAAADAARLTRTGAWVGTAGFLAPEQVDGRPVTPAADVFSLGCLLAYAATGITPFGDGPTGEVLHRITHADPEPAALASEDNNLQDLIKACLDKNPARRPTPQQIIDTCADTREGGAWLPAAISARIARRDAELADVLARAARQRTLYRIKLGALPMLLALAITMFITLGNNGGSGATPLTTGPAPTVTATAFAQPTAPTASAGPSAPASPSSPPASASAAAQPSTAAQPSATAAAAQTTPAAMNAPLTGPPRLLGAPDFDGYCRATGQGGAHLVTDNAYGWRCTNPTSTGDDAEAVCAWTYQTTTGSVTNRVTDFNNPNTWQCWHATQELGAINFDTYCQDIGYPGAYYVSGRYAYGWYCTNDPNALDTQDACLKLYGSSPPISRFQDFYDQTSWQCWG